MIICEKCLQENYCNSYHNGALNWNRCMKCFNMDKCIMINEGHLIKKQPMKEERIVKMTLETARKIWKTFPMNKVEKNVTFTAIDEQMLLYNLIIENFTKEELEGNKGYTWEESFESGYYYNESKKDHNYIDKACNKIPYDHFKNQFKTEKQALSALAFAQLSHIVTKYNEGKVRGQFLSFVGVSITGELCVCGYGHNGSVGILPFFDKKDAEQSLITNFDLWIQYWML